MSEDAQIAEQVDTKIEEPQDPSLASPTLRLMMRLRKSTSENFAAVSQFESTRDEILGLLEFDRSGINPDFDELRTLLKYVIAVLNGWNRLQMDLQTIAKKNPANVK